MNNELETTSQGIRNLSDESVSARLRALADTLNHLSRNPDEVAAKLEALPEDRRAPVREFLLLMSNLPQRSAEVLREVDGLLSRDQISRQNREEPAAPNLAALQEKLGTPIQRSEVLVVSKESKIEWDMLHMKVGFDDLLKLYEQGAENKEAILTSHLNQAKAREDFSALFSKDQVISGRKVTPEMIKNYRLIIALGGDDHFKFVTHLVDDETPVLGVNSDPGSSEGKILSCTANEFPRLLERLEKGDYQLAPWTRLRLEVGGKDCGPALSEIVLGKSDFRLMSRHELDFDQEKLRQKSSGFLISTGIGSTGWFASAGLYLYPQGRPFDATAPYARFELREPFPKFEPDQKGALRAVFPKGVEGVLARGEEIVLKSLNNSQGIASRDSIDSIPFPRGTTAVIRIDKKPLWVVTSPETAKE